MSISLTRIMPVTTELLTLTFLKEEGFKSHLKSRGSCPQTVSYFYSGGHGVIAKASDTCSTFKGAKPAL